MSIRTLFDTTRQIDRRIEKVVSYDSKAAEQLQREINEGAAELLVGSRRAIFNC
jgi:hypothetical protein